MPESNQIFGKSSGDTPDFCCCFLHYKENKRKRKAQKCDPFLKRFGDAKHTFMTTSVGSERSWGKSSDLPQTISSPT